MGEHRVSMLGSSWRRFEDPARSRDPRIRTLVASLATLDVPGPAPEFRAELRAQLVAITPRIVGESAGDMPLPASARRPSPRPQPAVAAAHKATASAVSATSAGAVPVARPRLSDNHSESFFAHVRRIRLGRPLAIAASVLTAFAVLLGGAAWMSRSALPGDALYGLKRASESFQLSSAGSGTQKARDYLQFAATRAVEARALLARSSASGPTTAPDPHTASLISATLTSADSDVKAASVLLSEQAIKSRSPQPLNELTSWAPSQIERLNALAAAMPPSPLRSQTESSANLVSAAAARARELAPAVSCGCLTTHGNDQLGPVPCTNCSPTPATPGTRHARTTPGTNSVQNPGMSVPGASGTNGTSGLGGGTVSSGSGGAPSSTQKAGIPLPSLNLPTPSLPLPKPGASPPLNVDSCGGIASLGPIGIGVGLCSSPHSSLTK